MPYFEYEWTWEEHREQMTWLDWPDLLAAEDRVFDQQHLNPYSVDEY